ncbi:DUF5302 domain-containing protein [Arsenicicoccus piscis]|uniref:DUF5302 domain-containing protein n=1 Tax=Arsenicicoccus piscis TaxID=673954 RepID=A0ABQ6HRF7_9MICO|nr:DUF5302 domain-containing protein [Arsenicicoccus piscis]MCH8626339.1 DUF5302 domain-containing protein [Arsenicicoccus piscis]GMA20946.1 hypothetical protein GCM10025862_29670 [Arsenicicoccus piscis]
MTGQNANKGPDEETKRKFREALDRKNAHAGRDVSDHSARSKAHGTHGPETSGTQQMFRRKSG